MLKAGVLSRGFTVLANVSFKPTMPAINDMSKTLISSFCNVIHIHSHPRHCTGGLK